MKLATIYHEDCQLVVAVDTTTQSVFKVSFDNNNVCTDMGELIDHYNDLKASLKVDWEAIPFSSVRFAAPIQRPRRNIFCVGKNYFEHAHEFAKSGFDSSATKPSDAVPSAPIVFTKMPETVVASGTPVGFPSGLCEQLDYEAELGVIIGKGGLGISKADAMSHVFGYVIINDLTARDLQVKHKQWFLGKSFDTSCPMGPWIATTDELDGQNLDVKCWVNSELRQNANTKDLIFDIPTLIETLSAGTTLLPGDIIATGTPVGVGIGFTPPKFLNSGDVVDIEITGLGRLSNPIK